jgi:DHA1 family bicyclomycin/chloramphenicol resistance-like MFS transporter
MARVMSVVMGVFILVPVLAPSLGQAALWFVSWRWLFALVLALGFAGGAWLAIRQGETLRTPLPLSPSRLVGAAAEFFRSRVSVAFTLAGACCYGAMLGYVNTAQQVFQDLYGVGDAFAPWFGGCALFISGGMLANSALVARFGMRRICLIAVSAQTGWATLFAVALLARGGEGLSFAWWLAFCCPTLFLLGLTFGNLSAIALRPLGHIAGTAAALAASLTTVVSLTIAAVVGLSYDGSVTPVVVGFLVAGAAAAALMTAAGADAEAVGDAAAAFRGAGPGAPGPGRPGGPPRPRSRPTA